MAEEQKQPAVPKKKRRVKKLDHGVVHIQSTFNNTILTLADEAGNVVAWNTAGASGFTGTKKSTPYAASTATYRLLDTIRDMGMKQLRIEIRGVGPGRESAIRALANAGVEITRIRDVTPIPHNGVRPKKARRV